VDVPDTIRDTRLLGLDIGRRRIGLALYDPLAGIVTGLDTLHRRTREEDLARLTRLAAERKAAAFVSGLPLNMDGSEGPQAAFVRDLCARLERASALPVYFQDERLTSVEAEGRLKDAGWSLKKLLEQKRKGVVDRMAAVLLLEDFIHACDAAAESVTDSVTEPRPSGSGTTESDDEELA
jgi:putative Holliday junction resolvase